MAGNLRQSLTALRRAFRAAGLEPVNSDRSTVGLDLAAGSIDAAIFAEGCNRSAARAKLAALYRGPFLDGLDTSAPEFEHWVTQKRRRLAALAAQMVCTASMSLLPPRDSEAAL